MKHFCKFEEIMCCISTLSLAMFVCASTFQQLLHQLLRSTRKGWNSGCYCWVHKLFAHELLKLRRKNTRSLTFQFGFVTSIFCCLVFTSIPFLASLVLKFCSLLNAESVWSTAFLLTLLSEKTQPNKNSLWTCL